MVGSKHPPGKMWKRHVLRIIPSHFYPHGEFRGFRVSVDVDEKKTDFFYYKELRRNLE